MHWPVPPDELKGHLPSSLIKNPIPSRKRNGKRSKLHFLVMGNNN